MTSSGAAPRTQATAIVPIKPWSLAKSRLTLGRAERAGLARAFALDVLSAVRDARSVGRVVIVSAEPELRLIGPQLGAVVLPDRPTSGPDMLNVAIDTGRSWAMSHRRDAPLVVVPADLAALTAGALDAALAVMSRHAMSFVPDVAGVGTTLMWSRDPFRLLSRYGPQSAARHRSAGFREVTRVDRRVRQDVDCADDLEQVRSLGPGAHTRAALPRLAVPVGASTR